MAALLLAFSAGAQPSEGWEISVGAPWRGFGTIELAAQDMTPGGAGLERFLDGQIQAVGAGLFAYTVADPLTQIDAARLDRITYTDLGSDAWSGDLGDAFGVDLELRRELWQDGPWRFGLSASFRWLTVTKSLVGTGATTSSQYSIYPNAWPSPNPPGGGPDPTVTTAYFLAHDPLQLPAGGGAAVAARHDLDLDVCELALGGFAAWERGPVQFGLSLAPVLALPRLELTSTAFTPGNPGSPQTSRDVADDVLPGIRVGADIRWQFYPPFFVALAAEYEWFADELEGDTVRMSLDGPALRAAVGCRF